MTHPLSEAAAWRDHAAALLSPQLERRRDPIDAVAKALADAYAAGKEDEAQ